MPAARPFGFQKSGFFPSFNGRVADAAQPGNFYCGEAFYICHLYFYIY
jgi:hypothetical protein